MERVILHSDANSFYANVECLHHPELRGKPVAVGGDPEARHGIILAKNAEAKRYGVVTAETIREAKDKCPWLIVLPPDNLLYLEFSRKLRKIYNDYSERVEPYGLDEAWVDVSGPNINIERGEKIANEIRRRAREEVGLTLSIGVSFNKVFAKLGSDLKKPDATSVISKQNYKQVAWRLPVCDLLFVGPATTKKLYGMGVLTIGDLAELDSTVLNAKCGKNGSMIQTYARGLDQSPVMPTVEERSIKSIGHSTTPPHDITNMEDAECILWLLVEAVSERLRDHGFRAGCISVSARKSDLTSSSCQSKLRYPTAITSEIAKMAVSLFDGRYASDMPFRSIGVHCSDLHLTTEPQQLDFFADHVEREKKERLDYVVDGLRKRFGHQIIRRGVVYTDKQYAQVKPDQHVQPANAFYGR